MKDWKSFESKGKIDGRLKALRVCDAQPKKDSNDIKTEKLFVIASRGARKNATENISTTKVNQSAQPI